ncbi:DUF503 domain-containing protein [Petrotoga sp. 9PWA.NaAc.5.4]|uniref:DUF503 domain-containing protein n=1 Tax=Petrotoga sp. 9PWA.NaAc.5.4 TaxID=1434328 RepID=UPI000CC5886C|nr:DUF503 domain-containing protein [Petrotoga sp. 9PWA.NaAc.5.4]PNR96754.1 hypothetical protein X924_02530 [Petrotoga sp. 9PWA.NaAc.5.4]
MFCLKLELKIRLFSVNSLKEKRTIVKSLTNNLRKKYNISVLEGNHNDSKNYLGIFVASLSQSRDYLLNLIEQIEEEIEMLPGLEIEDENYLIF